jgi:hypothetical protein
VVTGPQQHTNEVFAERLNWRLTGTEETAMVKTSQF